MPIYMVKKFDDMFNRFRRIPACDGRTDGRTDILRRRSPRYAWHCAAKKSTNVFANGKIRRKNCPMWGETLVLQTMTLFEPPELNVNFELPEFKKKLKNNFFFMAT